jgi:hypothetical protein
MYLQAILSTPRLGELGSRFSIYKYLREFEAKIGTSQKVV